MNTHYLTKSRKLFFHDLAPVSVSRHNARAWVRSIRLLGDKWILNASQHVERKQDASRN